MDPIPASPQNNQNFGKANLNSQPANVPEGNDVENINIKVPPKGMLDSSTVSLNSNGALKSDKNIKVDLDLNSAPASGSGYAKEIMNARPVTKPASPASQPVQSAVPPVQAPKSDNRNTEQYKLSNGEVQGPKPPLVPSRSNKLIFILIAGVAIGGLAIGGYYLLQKSGSDVPVATATPIVTPLPTIDPSLDSDADTIPDAVEKAIGTSLDKMDTDGDGYNDLAEIKSGYSPIVAGAAGKYTPEALQAVKDKIKAANQGFYAEVWQGE